jgi:hypothetical protein
MNTRTDKYNSKLKIWDTVLFTPDPENENGCKHFKKGVITSFPDWVPEWAMVDYLDGTGAYPTDRTNLIKIQTTNLSYWFKKLIRRMKGSN